MTLAHRTVLSGACALLAALGASSPAAAGVLLGDPDLTATPGLMCSDAVHECSLTQLDAPADAATLTAPADGIITRIRVRHSAQPSGDVNIPTVSFQVLSGDGPAFTLVRRTTGAVQISGDAQTEEFDFPDGGLPIAAGERLGLHTNDGALAFEYGEASGSGWNSAYLAGPPGTVASTSTYTATADSRVLMNAYVEPDADGDGYGDETEDGCPGNGDAVGPCPAPPVQDNPQPPAPSQPQPQPAAPVVPVTPAAPLKLKLTKPTLLPLQTTALKRLSSRGLVLRILCPDSCEATSKLYVVIKGRRILLGRGTRDLAKAGQGKLALHLTGSGKHRLHRLRTGRIELRTVLRDDEGRQNLRQTFTVRRKGGALVPSGGQQTGQPQQQAANPAPSPAPAAGGGGAGELAGRWYGVSHLSTIDLAANGTYTSPNGGKGTWSRSGDDVTFTGALTGFCGGHAKYQEQQIRFSCQLDGWPIYFAYYRPN